MEKKRKIKKWGDNGFTGKIQFGCYEYVVKFMPEKMVSAYIGTPSDKRTYGAVCCDEQIILISSELTQQAQKLSLMHELTHVVFLNNNVGLSEDKLNIQREDLVDDVAARFLEIMKRNPDLMRWLLK